MSKTNKSLFKNADSIGNIKESLNSFGIGIRKANSTSSIIIKTLYDTNREKRASIAAKSQLFSKRREAVRRREQEDLIEAGQVKSIGSSTSKTISNGTRGILGRSMNFVGTIIVGWILNNIPRIIKSTEKLMTQINGVTGVLSNWVGNTLATFGLFGGQVRTLQVSFDRNNTIDSQSRELEKDSKGIEKGIDNSYNDFAVSIQKLFNFSWKDIIDKKDEEMGISNAGGRDSGGGSSGGGSSGGGTWKPLLNLLGAAEADSSGGYNAIAPSDSNPNLSKMTIAEASKAVGQKGGRGAIGRYQFTTPLDQARRAGLSPDDLFSPENQDKMAINLIIERGGNKWLAGNMSTKDFIIALAKEWAGLPKDKSGKSWHEGYNGNSANVTYDSLVSALENVKKQPTQTTSTTSGSVDLNMNQSFSKNQYVKLGDISVRVASRRGDFESFRSQPHGGIDLACDPGLYISLRVDCEVVASGPHGGYGNLIDVWVPSYNVQLRFAHNTTILITSGAIPAGTSFATTGYTGNVRPRGPAGSHIHFEASTQRDSRNYGGNTSPNPYVSLIRLTRGRIEGKPGTIPDLNGTGGPSLSKPDSVERTTNTLSQGRRGQVIPIPIPSSSGQGEPQQVQQMGSGGGSSTTISLSSNTLNSFVSKTLLMELEYT